MNEFIVSQTEACYYIKDKARIIERQEKHFIIKNIFIIKM